ncbi:MAG: EAL and HDOD domain-containing protein [Campylobacterales bacterium]
MPEQKVINNTIIAKQPILLDNAKMYAYELLFRSMGTGNIAHVQDDRFATSRVLIDALNTFGLNKLVGDFKAFINVDKSFLLDPVVERIPKDRFVLEILETVDVDESVIERVKELKSLGYTIAIDDLDFSEEMIENFAPLLHLVDILKIDLLACENMDVVKDKIALLSKFNCELLAEKVEDKDIFAECKELGFKYFQGFFFSKPEIIEGKKIDPNRLSIMNLIQSLQTDMGIEQIVDEFSKNPQLTVNLLKYMNSSAFFTRNDITSIEHAVKLIGRLPLAQWLTLFLYAGDEEDIKSDPIFESALARAKSMEVLAKKYKCDKRSTQKAYLIGLVSLFDVILGVDFDTLFEEIKFDTEIQDAILKKEGKLGKILAISLIIQSQDMVKIERLKTKLKMEPEEFAQMLLEIQSMDDAGSL